MNKLIEKYMNKNNRKNKRKKRNYGIYEERNDKKGIKK